MVRFHKFIHIPVIFSTSRRWNVSAVQHSIKVQITFIFTSVNIRDACAHPINLQNVFLIWYGFDLQNHTVRRFS